MLLKPEPELPEDLQAGLNGIKPNFNGVGVFLYRSHTKRPGQWYVIALNNRGMIKLPTLEELILPAISCPIEVEAGTRGGIRVRMLKDMVEVDIRHANGDTGYDTVCARDHVFVNEPYLPYFGVVAANTNDVINDIDLLAVYTKNLDSATYQDTQALEDLKTKYILQKGGRDQEDIHAHDLLALRLQEQAMIKQRQSLSYFSPEKDD
jgi:hypothetical protein